MGYSRVMVQEGQNSLIIDIPEQQNVYLVFGSWQYVITQNVVIGLHDPGGLRLVRNNPGRIWFDKRVTAVLKNQQEGQSIGFPQAHKYHGDGGSSGIGIVVVIGALRVFVFALLLLHFCCCCCCFCSCFCCCCYWW